MSSIKSVSPNWPAPANVKALTTCRSGGVSEELYNSFNLAQHVGDNVNAVNENRRILKSYFRLPGSANWLSQTHSTTVICIENALREPVEADASYTRIANRVCTVLTADCLPVLLCNKQGKWVAAIHAGWRGLANGIIGQTILQYDGDSADLVAWLGPAIGPESFEVGAEVRDEFEKNFPGSACCFQPVENKFLADLYQLARIQLSAKQVESFGGDYCTYKDQENFYSYRRDGETGRMASLIWFE